MKGRAVGYVYAELQVVDRAEDPADKAMDGRHVVAVRLDLGGGTPTGVLMFSMAHAREMRDDLDRVLAEHAGLTGDS